MKGEEFVEKRNIDKRACEREKIYIKNLRCLPAQLFYQREAKYLPPAQEVQDGRIAKEKQNSPMTDNCSAHILCLKDIREKYLPLNYPAILQPLDLHIIRTMKTNYQKHKQ